MMKKMIILIFIMLFASCSNLPEGTGDDDCSDKLDNDKDGAVDCDDDGCRLDDYCLIIAAKALDAEQALKNKNNLKILKKIEPIDSKTNENENPYYVEFDKIMMQKNISPDDINWIEAKQYCNYLSLAGMTDWRLPTVDEASAGVKSSEIKKDSLVIWTSDKKSNKRALIVGITTGAVNDLGVNSKGQCRTLCVRDK